MRARRTNVAPLRDVGRSEISPYPELGVIVLQSVVTRVRQRSDESRLLQDHLVRQAEERARLQKMDRYQTNAADMQVAMPLRGFPSVCIECVAYGSHEQLVGQEWWRCTVVHESTSKCQRHSGTSSHQMGEIAFRKSIRMHSVEGLFVRRRLTILVKWSWSKIHPRDRR